MKQSFWKGLLRSSCDVACFSSWVKLQWDRCISPRNNAARCWLARVRHPRTGNGSNLGVQALNATMIHRWHTYASFLKGALVFFKKKKKKKIPGTHLKPLTNTNFQRSVCGFQKYKCCQNYLLGLFTLAGRQTTPPVWSSQYSASLCGNMIEIRAVDIKILLHVYRALHDLSPPYIKDMVRRYQPSRPLRSSGQGLPVTPKTHTQYGRRSFRAAAPELWNSLPRDIRDSETLRLFKRKLNLFMAAFNL